MLVPLWSWRQFFSRSWTAVMEFFPTLKLRSQLMVAATWEQVFQNKPAQKGCGMKWKRQICQNVSFGSICLSVSLVSSPGLFTYSYDGRQGLASGSRCTALTSRALHAALMPGRCASMLQLLPNAGKPRSSSTEDRRMVKATVISIKGIFCRSVRGSMCPGLSQDPGKIGQQKALNC